MATFCLGFRDSSSRNSEYNQLMDHRVEKLTFGDDWVELLLTNGPPAPFIETIPQ